MLRIGVIGVGSLGQHHARNYMNINGAKLVAIVDNNEAQAKKIAEKLSSKPDEQKNCCLFVKFANFFKSQEQSCSDCSCERIQVFTDYRDLLGKVDAVSIACPTPQHHEIAKFFLENNIHCLVEKPITVTLEEADELIELAKKNDLILQVGHIERFNPAIIEIQNYVKSPKYIDINRLGPYSARVAHVGVVLDLMVHDLDMVLFLTDSEVESVDAVGTRVISEHEDIANVRLRFKNGCVANISASRVSLDKFRKIRIFQPDSYISLDYEHQTFKVYRKKANVQKLEGLGDIDIFKFSAKKNEPLYLELSDFVDCVINHRQPKVSGRHGRNALKLALEVTSKINESLK